MEKHQHGAKQCISEKQSNEMQIDIDIYHILKKNRLTNHLLFAIIVA